MINSQFVLSIKDFNTFKQIKDSTAYRDYIKGVAQSPAFKAVYHEHAENVNITEDIKKYMGNDNKIRPEDLNTLFKDTLKQLIAGIISDTIILKELSDIPIDDVKNNLEDDFKIKYLLGLADEEFYIKANTLLKENPDTNSLLFKGLVEHLKRTDKITDKKTTGISGLELEKKEKPKEKEKKEAKSLDFSSDTIEL